MMLNEMEGSFRGRLSVAVLLIIDWSNWSLLWREILGFLFLRQRVSLHVGNRIWEVSESVGGANVRGVFFHPLNRFFFSFIFRS